VALLGGAATQKARHWAYRDLASSCRRPPSSCVPLDPGTHGDDISARRPTVVLANQTGNSLVGVEMGPDALATYAATPVMRDGKSLAVIDVGVAFGKEFVDRVRQRFDVDLAVHSFDGTAFKTVVSTLGEGGIATPDELRTAFNGTELRRDATFRRPSRRALSRPHQELQRPARRGHRVGQGHHRDTRPSHGNPQRDLILGTAAFFAWAFCSRSLSDAACHDL
jgi:methyl-accepting chemotaxis protein